MNDHREKKFLIEITPILMELNKGWFPPDTKTPDGQYYYACSYCDLNCSRHDKHDSNCYYQAAKETVEKWKNIDEDLSFDKSPIQNRERTPEEALSMRRFHKVNATLDLFFRPLLGRLVPFDYGDSENEGVTCGCNAYDDPASDHHKSDCKEQKLAQIFSDYYNPTKK